MGTKHSERIRQAVSAFTATRITVFSVVVALVVGLAPSQLIARVSAQTVERSGESTPATAPAQAPEVSPSPSPPSVPVANAAATPPPASEPPAPVKSAPTPAPTSALELAKLHPSLSDSAKNPKPVESAAVASAKAAKQFQELNKLGPEIESERELNSKVYAKRDGSKTKGCQGLFRTDSLQGLNRQAA